MKSQISRQPSKTTPTIPQAGRTQENPSTATPAPEKPTMLDDLHARIAARAYELYVQHGCREGRTVEDWLQAEREIVGRTFPV